MTVIKKSIGNAFMSIPSTYMQQWSSPKFNMGSVSRQGVAVGRNERTITDEVVRICAFLRDVQFATADQIVKGTGVNFDKAQNNLMSQHFVNSFVLTDIQDPSELRVQDALRIYTLDFAGVYLLSIEGYDMTTWRWTDYLVSATVVRKALVQTEIYVEMSKSTVCSIRNYQQFREFRIGAASNDVDFFVSLKGRANGQVWNFAGFVVEAGDEDLYLRDKLANLESVFHATKAGYKYFPDGPEAFPKLLLVIEATTDRNINAVKNLVGQVTSWAGADVAIVALDDIHKNGMANATYYSIGTKPDETGEGKIVALGKINMPLFK